MTDYLFAHPGFLCGMARALDLGDTLTEYNRSLSEEEADFIAMESDWMAVGDDIRNAIGALDAETETTSE